jgi:hypothetical protein
MYTNIGLVEHAKMALNEKWGYVWGTIGQVLTEALLQAKIKQYPQNIPQYESFIRANWMNRRTADCVNLIKSYIWWNNGNIKYTKDIDVSADGMYERAKEKGAISTIPEIPGLCIWYKGHIGVYIGNGEVIEARGTKYGVVKTKLKDRPWTHWLKCPFIEYFEEKKTINEHHWADDAFSYLKKCGLVLHEKRFDDNITRGECFSILAQIAHKIEELKGGK